MLSSLDQRQTEWQELCNKQRDVDARYPCLDSARLSPAIKDVVRDGTITHIADFDFSLSRETFARTLEALLEVENYHQTVDMRRYDLEEVQVAREASLFSFRFPNLTRGEPKLNKGQTLTLEDTQLGVSERCTVERVEGETVWFSAQRCPQLQDRQWTVRFHIYNIPHGRYVRTLRAIEGLDMIKEMLFAGGQHFAPSASQQVARPSLSTRNQLMDQRLAKCNEAQQRAVVNIVEAKFSPNCYIIFGPPGTGKTFTLVEAVGQVFQRKPHSQLLVCANSNNCVNDLAWKMLRNQCVKSQQVVRLCAANYYDQLVANRELVPVPEFFTDAHGMCADKRIVLTTNAMAYTLPRRFDFVFLDEAGHAHIPESLVPCSRARKGGCFVLAGDPKQLGPVVHSRVAGSFGLNESLIKRMFGHHIYGHHGRVYNEHYITKLVHVYRCDERIIRPCNELFYKDELVAERRTPPALLRLLSRALTSLTSFKVEIERPLLFFSTPGLETQPYKCLSRQNEIEAAECIHKLFMLYLMGFEPDQIGVITYYVLQRELLVKTFDEQLKKYQSLLNYRFKPPRGRPVGGPIKGSFMEQMRVHEERQVSQHLSRNQINWRCMIDTVDAFQGREKEIVLISTTRTPAGSDGVAIRDIGFLADKKRFNVAVSRAKWLCMVVGHEAVVASKVQVWAKMKKRAQIVRAKFRAPPNVHPATVASSQKASRAAAQPRTPAGRVNGNS